VEMLNTPRSIIIERLLTILIVGLSTGYALTSATTILLGLPSSIFNYGFRVSMVFVSIVLLPLTIMRKGSISLSGISWVAIFFWIIFSLRLLYDIEIRGIIFKTPQIVYSFAIGNCLLPFIAISLAIKFINLKLIVKYLFASSFICNSILLYLTINKYGIDPGEVTRTYFHTGENTNHQVINSILVGRVGESLILYCICYILFLREKHKHLFLDIICIPGLLIGIANISYSGARGPILGLILCLVFLFALRFVRLISSRRAFFKAFVPICILLIFSVGIIFFFGDSVLNSTGAKRLIKTFSSERVLDGRDFERQAAISQFLSNPILGDKYINDYDNFYPHNIYIEVLMSTGIVGGLLYFTMLLGVYYNIFWLCKSKKYQIFTPIIITFFVFSIFALFSGSIYFSTGFWAMTAILSNKKALYNSNIYIH